MTNIPAGKFFLGNLVNPKTQDSLETPFYYDSGNLVTHGVILGMTGSGKTGLSIDLLEEALLNEIPTIIIDPKGDMPNLALQFPQLAPGDFLPWVNREEALGRNMSPEDYAALIAQSWKFGLNKAGIGTERIQKLAEGVEFNIYTPGSDYGTPLNILDSFKTPSVSPAENMEAFTDLVESTVQSLLGLVGVEGDPLQSREFILLSNILQDRWRQGEDLTLETLIGYIMNPPVKKLGVFDVNTLYPQNDRMKLAMLLNNVAASPGFSLWMKGDPVDPARWLNRRNGKTPCSVFYIAHLSDGERMFFVTMLLGKIINYIRSLSGTTSLRALLYFDEVFGYLPPHPANPPSKTPILTILKQARAFGLGMVLATQNPVDLDYKALTNAGTWCIGKLSTDRDKKRILDGLDSSSLPVTRSEMDELISGLESRNFILNSAHLKEPAVFHSRFAQAYLRGPMTRQQIKELMEGRRPEAGSRMPEATGQIPVKAAAIAAEPAPPVEKKPEAVTETVQEGYNPVLPEIPPPLNHYFLNEGAFRSGEIRDMVEHYREKSDKVLYIPALMGKVKLRFDEEKARLVHYVQGFRLIFPLSGEQLPVWPTEYAPLEDEYISRQPSPGALFGELPGFILNKGDVKKLGDDLVDLIYRDEKIVIYQNPSLKMFGQYGEDQAHFELRCADEVKRNLEREVTAIRRKYQRKTETLSRRLESTRVRVDKARQDAAMRKTTEVAHLGESILGFFTSKKKSVGRAVSGAMSQRRMSGQAEERVKQLELDMEHTQEEMNIINGEMEDLVADAENKYADMVNDIQELDVPLEKNDITLSEFGVLWVPVSMI